VRRRGGEPTVAVVSGRVRGYSLVIVSYLVMGSIGALVNFARAPESMLIVLRMAIAGLVLGALFARRRTLREVRQPGVPRQLLLMAFFDAGGLLLFFVALRMTNVAIGMFLLFMAPVWVALASPRVLRQRTDPWVYPAAGMAFAGLAVILLPDLLGGELHVSTLGIVVGLAAGLFYCGWMLSMSVLRRAIGSATLVICECVRDSLFLLPLALWQMLAAGGQLTGRDLLVAAILGVVCTAFAYTIWTEGVGLVPVAHVSILGYLEPLSAPLWALLLLGERPTPWALLGGVLIIAAGALVVVRGRDVAEVEAAAEPPG
jgi:drug/metabolite transporter (DMT)-like permease